MAFPESQNTSEKQENHLKLSSRSSFGLPGAPKYEREARKSLKIELSLEFWPSRRPKIRARGQKRLKCELLGPQGVHVAPPGASWGSFWPSWGLLELILGLLGPPGAHFGPPRALPSTRSTKLSQTPFEITVQKVFSEPLKARCAIPYRLSGRLWGACAQLDPATEPLGSTGGR